jgi:hypothetical protein
MIKIYLELRKSEKYSKVGKFLLFFQLIILYLTTGNCIYYIKKLTKLILLEEYILLTIFKGIMNTFIIPRIFGNWVVLDIIIE